MITFSYIFKASSSDLFNQGTLVVSDCSVQPWTLEAFFLHLTQIAMYIFQYLSCLSLAITGFLIIMILGKYTFQSWNKTIGKLALAAYLITALIVTLKSPIYARFGSDIHLSEESHNLQLYFFLLIFSVFILQLILTKYKFHFYSKNLCKISVLIFLFLFPYLIYVTLSWPEMRGQLSNRIPLIYFLLYLGWIVILFLGWLSNRNTIFLSLQNDQENQYYYFSGKFLLLSFIFNIFAASTYILFLKLDVV